MLLQPGSPFAFAEHPKPHPWRGIACWTGTTVLQLHRPEEGYGVWKFFDAAGSFTNWYINFEAPVVKHVDADGGGCFDTLDHGIDIVIPADARGWYWKDYEDPARLVDEGRLAAAEGEAVMRLAHEVAGNLDAGQYWWSAWNDWAPTRGPAAFDESPSA